MKIIIFLVIENDRNAGCGGSGGNSQLHQNRNLSKELELCLSRWTNNKINPSFYDIDIKLICPNNNPPDKKFIDIMCKKYSQLEYIHKPHNEADNFPAGWYNVPLAGKVLEEHCDYDVAIHIDLDMILMRDFDKKLLEFTSNEIAKCAVYDKNYTDDYEEMLGIKKEFVTCFMTSTKVGKFYTTWYGIQCELQSYYENEIKPTKDQTQLWWEYCNCEEHAVDKMYYDKNLNITKLINKQFSRTQGYGSADYHKDHIKDLLFLHCHIDEGWELECKEYMEVYINEIVKR